MICVVDVETSGLPKTGLPKNHSDQPHILQAAWRIFDRDRTLVSAVTTYVNPGQVSLDEGAEKIHGISHEMVVNYGVPPIAMLHLLKAHLESCRYLVAYNLKFDKTMLERDTIAIGHSISWLNRPRLVQCDLMQIAADICKAGTGIWITLEAAMEEAGFDRFKPKHHADHDAGAAGHLFWNYVERGLIKLW